VENKKLLPMIVLWLMVAAVALAQKSRKSQMRDSVMLDNITIVGKSKTQQLREGALSVNAIDVRSMISSISNLNTIIDHTAGVKIREEGGMGSDFDLSINGMSGNAVRYFIDGMPLDTKGSGTTLATLPISMIDHIEIYKGVVPTWLSSDALGGAVNVVTNRKKSNYLDASYGYGSFDTHRADLNGQWTMANGITIRPTLGISYSKNNYMMKGIELWDEASRKYLPQDRKRFHDGYLSMLGHIEAGVNDRWWADEFFVSASFNMVDKDLQTGQVQSRVIGMANRTNKAWSIGTRYQKQHFLLDDLSATLSLSHTWDHAVTTDTAHRQYDWNGDYIASARNEINGRAFSERHIKRPLTIARADLNYRITDEHMLNLSYALNRTGNNRWDEVDKEFEPANDVLAKQIIGLAYNQSLMNGRMYNTFFVKDYVNYLSVEQTDLPFLTNSREVPSSSTQNNWGGGIGTRYEIIAPIAVKASYEHSVRLPLARELLGNGTSIYANLTLKPETSDNLNLGFFGTLRTGAHTLYYETNGFLRFVDNYIQPLITEKEGTMQYGNEPAVHIKGIEGEMRYDWNHRLQVVGNISWQDARNRNRYMTDGKPSVTFNNRVPNRPWLFASAEAHYTLTDVLQKADRLLLGADYQWVHWFYLSWEAYGNKDTKARIPEKSIIGANITYSWQKERFSVSLDCQNLLDQTVYDNYKLQKPGRTLFVKFRTFLH
jgi:outer membrane cobalamin receptor